VPMAWSLRTGQLSDVDPVLRLWVAAGAEPTHTDDVASVTTLVAHDPSALIVAEEDGAIVGSVIAAWDGWRGSVYRLVVAPSHRRLGLGRQLLGEAEAHLAAVGAVRMQAIVVDTEPEAIGFWRESGWDRQVHRARFVRG
jgi:ribosomal protein S18 acetylase RimI-like enzyme